MNAGDFDFLQTLLKRRSGLWLTPERIPLVMRRLQPIARRYGFREVAELVRDIERGNERLALCAVEAMTVCETSFFRDPAVFAAFREELIPALVRARPKGSRLRFWCTAAATGQEAYSLAIVLHECRHLLAGREVELLATDLNPPALARALEGRYSRYEVQRGLSYERLMAHFSPEGPKWRIDSSLRAMVRFSLFNLLDSCEGLGTFDAIFCRNVLLYFDHATRAGVLARLAGALAPDGHLVLGRAETVAGVSAHFLPLSSARSIYVRNPAVPAARADSLAAAG